MSTLSALAENVAPNGARGELCSVAGLRWGDADHIATLLETRADGFDTIIASDVLYYPPETYPALADTIRALAAPNASVALGYLLRHSREGEIVDLLKEDFEVVTRATFGGAAASTVLRSRSRRWPCCRAHPVPRRHERRADCHRHRAVHRRGAAAPLPAVRARSTTPRWRARARMPRRLYPTRTTACARWRRRRFGTNRS